MSENGTAGITAIDIVDELEELVGTARRVPLSANVIVNEDETLELIDRLRMGLPEELVQARHTVEDRTRIIAAAEEEAEQVLARTEQEAARLLQEASERAQSMVTDSVITQQAHARAAEIVAEAEARAASIRSEADIYARDVMTRLEEQLTRAAATVRRGIDALPAPAGGKRRKREGDL